MAVASLRYDHPAYTVPVVFSGSTTAGALKKMGAEFIVEAEKPDDDCLFEAIKKAIK
mgnify:CR=1 FL=1